MSAMWALAFFEESTLVLIAINGVLAYSFYAVLVAGQLSLAQIGCAAIAAFTAAKAVPGDTVAGFIPPLAVSIVIGMTTATAASVLIGLPVMRLRGVYLAIATLGFGEMVKITLNNMSWTGGALGMRVDKLVTLPIAVVAVGLVAYWFARQRPSRLGRALAAIREDEVAAASMGIDVRSHRLVAFASAGAVAGLYGVLYAHFTRFIEPNAFDFAAAVDGLMMAVVGGVASFVGPLLGSAFLGVIPDLQRALGLEAGWIRPFLAGLLLLVVILFLPGGLAEFLPSRRRSAPGRLSGADSSTGSADEPADSLDDTLLNAIAWSKSYGGVGAVRDVDLEVRRGEIVGLIGPNGAGKTTLVNMISGLVPPTSGRATVLGLTITGRTRADRVARAGLGRTFQHSKLFARLSALENVLVGAHRLCRPTFARRLVWLPSAARDERHAAAQAWAQLDRVGLGGRATTPAAQLAYGDQRRLEIARALASRPALLILDEPAAGMNHVEATELGALIRSLAADGITVLLIEHNVRMVLETCTRVVVMNFGEVIASGDPQTVARDPVVIDAYLGSADHGGDPVLSPAEVDS
jgi:branched-chain amino acid transport system permease protein